MGFRDETVALRHQKQVLEGELRVLGEERERLRSEIAETQRSIEEQVAAGVAGAGVWPGIAIVAVSFLFGLMSLIPGDPGGNATMFGRARAVSGDAPVQTGAPCTTFLEFLDRKGDSTSSRLEVICAGRTVYGGGEGGYLPCDYDDDERVIRCSDTDFTSSGGDPRLALDRGSRTIVIEERAPTWRIEIELTVLPVANSPEGT